MLRQVLKPVARTVPTRRLSGVTLGLLVLLPVWTLSCSGEVAEGDQSRAGLPAGEAPEAPLPNNVAAAAPPSEADDGAPTIVSGPGVPVGGADEEAALPADSKAVDKVPPTAVPPPSADPTPQGGLLTAGIWDDNLNFERFLDYYDQSWVDPSTGKDGALAFTKDDYRKAAEKYQLKAHDVLDLALVLDATGSMGDEIRYLQAEFEELNQRIHGAYPDAEQRWSLIVYRDEHDEYVTKVYDFDEDAAAFRDVLALQSASGGGDVPEGSHAALAAMNQLTWRSDDGAARLAFWVADAPHHARYAKEMRSAILTAQDQGIHLYPVFASGPDPYTEFSMRSAAQLTGGRYLFLTDDSGVGGKHQEPNIACYYVTPLSEAILRVVESEMSGEHVDVSPNSVIRSVGSPTDNVCQLAAGKTATAF